MFQELYRKYIKALNKIDNLEEKVKYQKDLLERAMTHVAPGNRLRNEINEILGKPKEKIKDSKP